MKPTGPDAEVETRSCVQHVLGTPLLVTTYADLSRRCQDFARLSCSTAIEFANTQVVTMRRHEPAFRENTRPIDYFVPDGMPLIWCMNWCGAKLEDRVYGPTFMRLLMRDTPAPFTHYLLGGSPESSARLLTVINNWNSRTRVAGVHHGVCHPDGELADPTVIDEINRLSPDFIWIALGTPKQQAWIHKYKGRLRRGVVLSVGFAFDANAGNKRDAPLWMQRHGLTWLFRMMSEPGRLGPRYFRYNSLFLFYLLWDGMRGRAFSGPAAAAAERTSP